MIKYETGWDFDTFLYKNYGISHTSSDRSKALAQFINRLNNDKALL